ncbi:MAG: hypothetical protein ACJ71Y_07880 [Blastococcus sp.]
MGSGRAFAGLLAAVLAIASVTSGFLSAICGPPNGGTGAGVLGGGLLVSAAAGIAATGCVHVVLDRPARWRRLALGLLPALAAVLWLIWLATR